MKETGRRVMWMGELPGCGWLIATAMCTVQRKSVEEALTTGTRPRDAQIGAGAMTSPTSRQRSRGGRGKTGGRRTPANARSSAIGSPPILPASVVTTDMGGPALSKRRTSSLGCVTLTCSDGTRTCPNTGGGSVRHVTAPGSGEPAGQQALPTRFTPFPRLNPN